MPLLEARHIHKRFGDQVVLEEINLAFEPDQLNGIMGPNGAGKTTCFNVLTGRYKPSRGQVLFDGEDITGQPPRRIARKGVSRSFQIMNLFDEFTAIENVLLALPEVRKAVFRTPRDLFADSALQDRAADILEKVGLRAEANVIAADLSYGNRRALEIGVALGPRPRILFLDEPTAGLGTDATSRLAALIRQLRVLCTIVIIEHDMRFLFALADRISVIHWGQVIAQGTPDELKANKWVQASNLGQLS